MASRLSQRRLLSVDSTSKVTNVRTTSFPLEGGEGRGGKGGRGLKQVKERIFVLCMRVHVHACCERSCVRACVRAYECDSKFS